MVGIRSGDHRPSEFVFEFQPPRQFVTRRLSDDPPRDAIGRALVDDESPAVIVHRFGGGGRFSDIGRVGTPDGLIRRRRQRGDGRLGRLSQGGRRADTQRETDQERSSEAYSSGIAGPSVPVVGVFHREELSGTASPAPRTWAAGDERSGQHSRAAARLPRARWSTVEGDDRMAARRCRLACPEGGSPLRGPLVSSRRSRPHPYTSRDERLPRRLTVPVAAGDPR